jgi:hypothetical protein
MPALKKDEAEWRKMLARSFHPRQWFEDRDWPPYELPEMNTAWRKTRMLVAEIRERIEAVIARYNELVQFCSHPFTDLAAEAERKWILWQIDNIRKSLEPFKKAYEERKNGGE